MSQVYFDIAGAAKSYERRAGSGERDRSFYALHPLTAQLFSGRCYALVGESGSGKTTLARLLAGMTAPSEGDIRIEGQSLAKARHGQGGVYARRVQMIFQNPFLSLDPKWKIGAILEEGLGYLPRAERVSRAARVLEQVALPASYRDRRPSALSGGERQRVAIARALAVEPDYLILDEPTSQLDVSVQAQILQLVRGLKPRFRGGMLLITHDLALASQLADEILVLREGQLVESGACAEVLHAPRHPYTQELLAAVPVWKRGGQG